MVYRFSPDLALIDADSMIYVAAATSTDEEDYCDKLMTTIEKQIADLHVEDAYVFVKGKDNFRYQCDIEYKQNRVNAVPEDMRARITKMYDYGKDFFVESDNGEADDYCFIYAMKALEEGRLPVVAHIDKDLNMIPGLHYNFKKKEKYIVTIDEAHEHKMTQLITGDASDNIKGIRGFGPVKTFRYMEGHTHSSLFKRVCQLWEKHEGDNWKNKFLKCANCIIIRDHEDDLRPLTFEEIEERCQYFDEQVAGYERSYYRRSTDKSLIQLLTEI